MAYPFDFGAEPTLTTGDEWERIARLSRPVRAAEVAALPSYMGESLPRTPAAQSPLSKALRGETDYGDFLSGGQLISRRPMMGGGYMETTSPGDPRSLAGQWARGLGAARETDITRLLPLASQRLGGIEESQRQAARTRPLGEQEAGKLGLEKAKLGYAITGDAERKIDELVQQKALTPEQGALQKQRLREQGYYGPAQKSVQELFGQEEMQPTPAIPPAAQPSLPILEAMARGREAGAPPESPASTLRRLLQNYGEEWVSGNWPAIQQQLAQRPRGLESIRAELAPSVMGSMIGQTGQAIGALNPWATANWWTPEGRQQLRELARTPISQSLSRALGRPVLGEQTEAPMRRLLGM